MSPQRLSIPELARRLDLAYGDPGWWPGESPFEVAVGAILTQNTAWANVEKAMDALRRVGALAPSPLVAATPEQLEQWIRPTGYYRQKADRLRRLARWWLECLGPDPFAQPDGKTATSDLREALLKLKGVGPETADSILLYAFARPEFVVDAYTARLAVRLGLMSPPFGYDELKECFTSRLPRDTALYNRLHAQIVLHAKDRCRKLSPLCPDCPLKEFCRGPEADTE